mmetsp:Transcript_15086/g.29733  ORF Transcript_15086/g.29733 Transcript_15086/m.29733 type:complete len:231 (-) Transcript_15086:596-1288(-)
MHNQTRVFGRHNHIILAEDTNKVVAEGAVALLRLGLHLLVRNLAPRPQLVTVDVVKLALLVSRRVVLRHPLGVCHRALHPLLVPLIKGGRVAVRLLALEILDGPDKRLLVRHLGSRTQRLLLGTCELLLEHQHIGVSGIFLREVLRVQRRLRVLLLGHNHGGVEVGKGVCLAAGGGNLLPSLVEGGRVHVDELVVVGPELGLAVALVLLALLRLAAAGLVVGMHHGRVQV